MGDKWTLLIVRDLASGPRRFVEIQRTLPGISTEQLRSRLNRMVADGLLTRQRYREVPPRVDYELTERAAELLPVIGALARWGYDWTWTGPRRGEDVNVGAILRTAPGLLAPPSHVRGSLLCVVEADGEQPERSYVLTAEGGRVSISEQPADSPAATARGPVEAWVQALRPEGRLDSLQLSGRRDLADALLGEFVAAAAAGRAAA